MLLRRLQHASMIVSRSSSSISSQQSYPHPRSWSAASTSSPSPTTSSSSSTNFTYSRPRLHRVSRLNGRGVRDVSLPLASSIVDQPSSLSSSSSLSPAAVAPSIPSSSSTHSWLLSLRTSDRLASPTSTQGHISTWLTNDRSTIDPIQFSILPASKQLTQWLLPDIDQINDHTLQRTSAHVHTRPPPRVKSYLRRFLEAFLSITTVVSLVTFYFSHIETVPLTGRKHFIALSEEMERMFGEFLLQYSLEDVKVISDPRDERVKLVKQVGARIASAADRPNWEWKFYVVDDPQVNAFCMPGGTIVVYTGLLDLLWTRELAYRERMRALGLEPIVMLDPKESAAERVRTTYSEFYHLPPPLSKEAEQQAYQHDVWPWIDHALIQPPKSLWRKIADWGVSIMESDATPSSRSDATTLPSTPANVVPDTAISPLPTTPFDHMPSHTSPSTSSSPLSALLVHHPHDIDSRGLRIDRDLLSNHLAVILGHEVGHALARHTSESLSWMPVLYLIGLVNQSSPILNSLTSWFISLPRSRLHESEADAIGLILMSRACYHPGSAAAFWYDISMSDPSALTHYFSTHPADQQRAHQAKMAYPEAMDEMKRCCR